MQHDFLIALLLLLVAAPFGLGGLSFLFQGGKTRTLLVLFSAGVVITASVLAALSAPFSLNVDSFYGMKPGTLVMVLDFLLLAVVLAIGLFRRHLLIILLALAQIGGAIWLEFGLLEHAEPGQLFVCDELATVMILVISIVGSIICAFALPYMKEHEHHLKLARSKQPAFFAVLILFLGAMNGLVLCDDFLTFYFFFEVTTLCSFLLIGHDNTEEARQNSMRALWMNSLGGALLLGGIIWLVKDTGSASISHALTAYPASGLALIPLGLLLLAAFTKSAQLPFQSWLCGAMVAPTPVSALLHSSTMVKAGVYLALRLAPAYAGTLLADALCVFGAFVFLATAMLALTQSNGKKILAYSTISNLGLIFACAGLGTPGGIMAAILLIMFHAVSKGLLFLCVGSIEQVIGSRDLEDMRGLFLTMPRTAIITSLGVLTMILPPFGMLMGKWMILEAAVNNLPALCCLALGSGVTVAYWARFMGVLMSAPPDRSARDEKQPLLIRSSLSLLILGAVGLSLAGPWIYQSLSTPLVRLFNSVPGLEPTGLVMENMNGVLLGMEGGFAIYPLILFMIPALLLGLLSVRRSLAGGRASVYMSGIGAASSGDYTGPMGKTMTSVTSNYYLGGPATEKALNLWLNPVALLIMATMLVLGGLV